MSRKLFKLSALFLLLSIVPIATLMAQDEEEELTAALSGFRFLNYQNDLPEQLLKTRSVVFVSVPYKDGTSLRGDWQELARTVHKDLKEAGVDPVAYYYLDDVLAGPDASNAFARDLKARKIENIILLSHVKLRKNGERFVMVITPFNGQYDFISHGQSAWKTYDKKADRLGRALVRTVNRTGMKKENLLIADEPEFFQNTKIFRGKRFETAAFDLKVDQLAVPKFNMVEIPEDRAGGLVNRSMVKTLEEGNAKRKKDNEKLAKLLEEKYPFKYKLVDYDFLKEDDLRKQGNLYVLQYMYTSGKSLRRLLNYNIDETETDYITLKSKDGRNILRTLPVDAMVYKFYVRHIFTGDVYLGREWDADETWEEALENFMANLRKEVK